MDTLLSQTNGDVLVVYLADTNLVSAARIDEVSDALLEAMKRAEHGKLLLNFQAVRSMASAMLGKLLKLRKLCETSKVDLKLCNICDNILEVFQVTKLNKVFDIHDEEATALKAFAKRGWLFRR